MAVDAHGVTLLTALRSATREAHGALDRRVDLQGLVADRGRYVALLRATLAVVGPLEPVLATNLLPEFDWFGNAHHGAPVSRSARIEHDLQQLGASRSVVPLTALPDVSDRARAFGAAYVLQGSLLGGAVIARSLIKNGNVTPNQTTYLQLYGDSIGRVWQQFTAALNGYGNAEPPSRWALTIDTATAVFLAFDHALTSEGLA